MGPSVHIRNKSTSSVHVRTNGDQWEAENASLWSSQIVTFVKWSLTPLHMASPHTYIYPFSFFLSFFFLVFSFFLLFLFPNPSYDFPALPPTRPPHMPASTSTVRPSAIWHVLVVKILKIDMDCWEIFPFCETDGKGYVGFLNDFELLIWLHFLNQKRNIYIYTSFIICGISILSSYLTRAPEFMRGSFSLANWLADFLVVECVNLIHYLSIDLWHHVLYPLRK